MCLCVYTYVMPAMRTLKNQVRGIYLIFFSTNVQRSHFVFFDGAQVPQADLFSNLIKLIVTMRNAALQRFNITLQVLCSLPYGSQRVGAVPRGEKSPFRPVSDLRFCCLCPQLPVCIVIKRVFAASKGALCMHENANFIACLTNEKRQERIIFF